MSPAPASQELVLRASRGDPVAVEDLLALHLPALRAFVRLRCGPMIRAKESSSDLVQSVCRELLGGLDGFQYAGDAAFKSWLFTAAARKIADRAAFWQAGKREAAREAALPSFGASASGDAAMIDVYRTAATPSEVVMGREALERIEAAFDTLPDDYREAVVLSRVLGMSRSEVATAMGRSETAVRHLLFRGLAQLSGELEAGRG